MKLPAGTTSFIKQIFVRDSNSTSGAGKTGLAYNSPGLKWYYKRSSGSAPVAVNPVNIATFGVYVSGGFREVDAANMPGIYEIHLPDAALVAGATSVAMLIHGAAGMAPVPLEIDLARDDVNVVAVGGTGQTGGDLAALIAAVATAVAAKASQASVDGLVTAVDTKASQASVDGIAAAIPDLATEANLNGVGALVADTATAAALALVAEAVAAKASQASVDGVATAVAAKASQASVDGIAAAIPDLATEANVNAVGALVADTATAVDVEALTVLAQWLVDVAKGETRRVYGPATYLEVRKAGQLLLKKRLMTVDAQGADADLPKPLGNSLLVELADEAGV